jgi:DNA-binding MarR family transcriptional regulator
MNKEKDDLVSKIFLFTRLLRVSVHSEGFDHGSILQCRILSFIKEHENPPMKDIASYLHITQASATSLINRLVKKGLIIRREDADDRRVVRVLISVKGRQFLKDKYGIFSAGTRKIIEHLSRREQNDFSTILGQIIKR